MYPLLKPQCKPPCKNTGTIKPGTNHCKYMQLFCSCCLKMHSGQNLKSRASVLKPEKNLDYGD